MSEVSCKSYLPLIGPLLDGELEPARGVELEDHLRGCELCKERMLLDRATRSSLKKTSAMKAPAGLRERALVAMQAEARRSPAKKARDLHMVWMVAVPALAAAAVFAVKFNARMANSAQLEDNILSDFVAEHSRPLPPERTDPKDVRAFEQYVGVPVRPVSFKSGGARFLGGRVLPMHHEHAAMLQYEVGSGSEMRRVSVMVFDPRRIQVHGTELLPRSVGTTHVEMGKSNGYSVAVMQNDGIGYAVASDMDADQNLEMVSFAGN